MLYLLIILLFPFSLFSAEAAVFPWIVYYNDLAPPEAFDSYNPIVFHTIQHPPLEPLLQKKKVVLGYLNAGEADKELNLFLTVQELGLIIKENPNWPGSWMVDIRNPSWSSLLLDNIIPEILAQGFNGLFLDQLDVPLFLEKTDPKKYKGMSAAAVNLVKAIRKKFPDKYLMMNRAYELLPQLGDQIDFELAETLYTSYNFDKKQYLVRPKSEYEWQLAQLNKARAQFPRLGVFSLDYCDPKDQVTMRIIYAAEREQCIRPYVSTIALNEIFPEPAPETKK